MTPVVLDDHVQRRRAWLQASVEVTRCLLSPTGEQPLEAIARAVNQVAEADLTLVVLPTFGSEEMMVEVAVGDGTDGLVGTVFAAEGSVTGDVTRTGRAVLVDDVANTRPASARVQGSGPAILVGPVMVVPLLGDRGARGALAIARRCGAPPFTDEDLELATAFANHAAIALELADARAYQQRMALLEDRHRIAAELHDHVLQRLFATGMSMQAMSAAVASPHAQRLEELIADTDETIGRIRAVIHDLHDDLDPRVRRAS
jgi:signal transduction histidine kinase